MDDPKTFLLDRFLDTSYNLYENVRHSQEVAQMLTRLSSRGQLVIPGSVRKALGLRAGTRFYLRIEEGKIVLEPIQTSPVDILYGKYRDADFIVDLEAEHRQEIMEENAVACL